MHHSQAFLAEDENTNTIPLYDPAHDTFHQLLLILLSDLGHQRSTILSLAATEVN